MSLPTLRYDVTDADLLAWNDEFARRSPALRIARVLGTLMAAFALAVLAWALWPTAGRWLPAAVALVSGVIVWATYPAYLRRNLRRMSRRDGLGTTGPHQLDLDEIGVHERGPAGATTVHWDHVRQPVSSDGHVFIPTGPTSALVLPRRGQAAAVDAFAAEVGRRARG